MTNHHDLMLSDLVRFVTDAARQLEQLSLAPDTHQERKTLLPPPRLEIPTAVVVAGETSGTPPSLCVHNIM